jgi:hypothetical protein
MSRRVDGAVWLVPVNCNPTSINAGLQAEVPCTNVPSDVEATDVAIGAQKPGALEAGLAFEGVRVTGAGAVSITIGNNTAGAIDGADLAWVVAIVGNESPV